MGKVGGFSRSDEVENCYTTAFFGKADLFIERI